MEVRLTKRPDILEESCFVRVLMPGGGFLSPALIRAICELADRFGSGLIDFTTTAGTIEIKEVRREHLTPLIRALNALGLDVGSGGDDIRHMEACVGPARCEHALLDTIALHYTLGMATLEDQQFPRFPHKIKIRIAGCPNDCIRAVQRAVVGVFRDLPWPQWFGQPVAASELLKRRQITSFAERSAGLPDVACHGNSPGQPAEVPFRMRRRRRRLLPDQEGEFLTHGEVPIRSCPGGNGQELLK